MLNKTKALIGVAIYSLPMLALAQGTAVAVGTGNRGGVDKFMILLGTIFDALIPIMIALALIYFIYGLAEYILEGSGDTGKKEEGRTRMIYGTIAMFCIASVWGLVAFLQGTIGVGSGNAGVVGPRTL